MSDSHPMPHSIRSHDAPPGSRWVTIAHRGASGDHGDNTHGSFMVAIDDQVGIETDVRRTSDGILLLAHGRQVAGAPIDQITHERVRAVNPDIVTMRWLLEHCSPELLVVIEVKYRDLLIEHGSIELSLLEELERVGRLAPKAAGRTVVSSFSPGSLLTIKNHAPQLIRFQVFEGLSAARPTQMRIGQLCDTVRGYATAVVPNVTDLETVAWAQQAHKRALGVFPYPDDTIISREQHRTATALMIRSGSDGGHVNYPRMARALQGRWVLPASDAMQRFVAWQVEAATALEVPSVPTDTTLGASRGPPRGSRRRSQPLGRRPPGRHGIRCRAR
jgi:glycerophosphoryl diester phosphodiesterase